MAYKALYRKYRPTTFDEVVGQSVIIKTLKNAIREQKISHAYLFTGTRGTGKTTIAKIFAKTINCLNLEDGSPCGKCEICKQENTDEIQDIIEIDAASNNGVDEIREIKNRVNLVPTICKYKVYIIDEVHMLSIGAFNALLKTLEEPPMHVIFILATTEPQKIPATIISRCQRYDFKKITLRDVEKHLKNISEKEKIDIDDECLEEISKLGDGSMRDSIGLLEQAASYTDKRVTIGDIHQLSGSVSRNQILDLINKIINREVEQLLDFFDEFYNDGKDFGKLTEDLMLFLRNVLICKNAPKYFEKKNIIDKEEISKIANEITEEKLIKIIRELNILLSDLKKSSQPNILFELFLFKITESEENVDEISKKEIYAVLPKDVIEEKIVTVKKTASEQPKMEVNFGADEQKCEIKLNFTDEKREISEYKKVLINNTIALADKEELKFIQETWRKLQTYLIKKKYKEVATILLDSKINAVSKDHILLTYKYDSMVVSHDKETKKIEELICDMTERNCKIVAITENDWNGLRPYYVELRKKNKKIDLIEEKEVREDVFVDKKEPDSLIDTAIDVFGEELIEMEG